MSEKIKIVIEINIKYLLYFFFLFVNEFNMILGYYIIFSSAWLGKKYTINLNNFI